MTVILKQAVSLRCTYNRDIALNLFLLQTVMLGTTKWVVVPWHNDAMQKHIFAIVMVILFFNAAPARSNIEVHRGSEEAAECLKCHLRGDEKSPTMPHLNVGQCNLCHGLSKEKTDVK
jgi:hypothetical protein